MTNLDHAKTIHLAKGEIVGFVHDKEVKMNYIETTSTLEKEENEYMAPCNWIPARKTLIYQINQRDLGKSRSSIEKSTVRQT